ncbi:hypothetical protein CLAFUW4_02895 [Fulvia fulva]|uniref:Uncharacterized protein n=1 Tax=Passalora fulva TaxID=5499 RepID=A0A9Q8P651_PASFU|nr:uncharacterized protein CLAFUR5_02883 [Fulvia fulva]KAK4631732.1 hypothetical protein CLAFUR4_02888 [Fulvia fulva]KAK4633805.1 hypothetical protein CLAFUR0_02891 [Fulvia fulva]UJO14462.1 hypothetical protein CLAFUR5_02883 [Fulvia fulva]WPV11487.1 hypothetical protein CLAFUW4_02895 [Fulvia fulva]WPV26897.1 hypothetical protein CLAFUW7_02892 [Fulvia fulva]
MFGGPPPPPSAEELRQQELLATATIYQFGIIATLLYFSPFAVDAVKKLV